MKEKKVLSVLFPHIVKSKQVLGVVEVIDWT